MPHSLVSDYFCKNNTDCKMLKITLASTKVFHILNPSKPISSTGENQTWSRLRNRDRKPSRFDSRSSRFRFEPIRVETSKSRFVIDFFNFDFGIYICMFSEKSVLFRYYRNVTDSYRKYVMTIKITVLLPIFFPPSLFHRFDTDVYNK
jgi:hypothetical protein